VAQLGEEKVKAFEEGKSVISTELKGYFKEHPDIYKGFLGWSGKEKNQRSRVVAPYPIFCLTFICLNTTKIGQDPSAKFLGKNLGRTSLKYLPPILPAPIALTL